MQPEYLPVLEPGDYRQSRASVEMRRKSRGLTLAAFLVAAVWLWALTLSGAASADSKTSAQQGQGQAGGSCAFEVVRSENVGPSNSLNGVAPLSTNNVWAVGSYNYGATERTLIERWNGTAWVAIQSPNVNSQNNSLEEVSAINASDVWAVGTYQDGSTYRTLAMHWDGAVWTVITSPNEGTSSNYLRSVVAIAPNDVWAVGYYFDSSTSQDKPLTMHWDGTQWTIVAAPVPPSGTGELFGVTAVSTNDLWAVGNISGLGDTLTMHWDGSAWSIVASPNVASSANYLREVDAISPNDVWVVGFVSTNITFAIQTLTMHWDGSTWTIVASPNPSQESSVLAAVSAASTGDVWAVGWSDYEALGTQNDPDLAPTTRPLSLHWDGTTWTVVANAATHPNFGGFEDVGALTTSDVWAAGTVMTGGGQERTYTERWSGTQWMDVKSANQGIDPNYLSDVSAAAPDDVWAVGTEGSGDQGALIEHWNGTEWSIVSVPSTTGTRLLRGVDALTAADAWAVGMQITSTHYVNLIMHWDGMFWQDVPSPRSDPNNQDELEAVSAVSTNDVWAVGLFRPTSGLPSTLMLHWNGAAWSIVPSPNLGEGVELKNVHAIATDNVWAVGEYRTGGTTSAIIMHWDGAVWSIVNMTVVPGSLLTGLSSSGPNDVWAVGYVLTSNPTTAESLAMHWDGTAWSRVTTPDLGDLYAYTDVSVVSANNVWVSGVTIAGTTTQSLVQHWDGTSWSTVPSANVGTNQNSPLAIVAVGSGDIWTVGHSNDLGPTPEQTLIERYVCACDVSFADVVEGSTFYANVQCLACQQIINGYACGGPSEPCNVNNDPYFRPNNNVTRGQIAKIVALAAGLQGVPTGQTFEDVAIGSTFYVFIEQLVAQGVMSGYPCGGPGEPCGAGNLPYFRPNSTATRGQITKIDANAAGYNDTPMGQQFQDVPVGSTFYTFTYQLATRNIMSGYACGGPGEPCGAGNLPYFRPGNNVTRGQTSKIVGNTFFPACNAIAKP